MRVSVCVCAAPLCVRCVSHVCTDSRNGSLLLLREKYSVRMQDPYLLVKSEVEGCLKRAFASKERVENGDQKALGVMDGALASAGETLQELTSAIEIMQKDPARFNLSADEVSKRVSQVQALKSNHQQLNEWCTTQLKSANALAAKDRERKPRELRQRTQADVDAGNGIDPSQRAAADDYFNDAARQHQELIERQDEDLDDIGNAVINIGEMGKQIGEELDSQGRLLDELDDDMDKTGSRLQNLNQKMNVMLKKSGNCQMGLIAGLVICFIVLCIFVFR